MSAFQVRRTANVLAFLTDIWIDACGVKQRRQPLYPIQFALIEFTAAFAQSSPFNGFPFARAFMCRNNMLYSTDNRFLGYLLRDCPRINCPGNVHIKFAQLLHHLPAAYSRGRIFYAPSYSSLPSIPTCAIILSTGPCQGRVRKWRRC